MILTGCLLLKEFEAVMININECMSYAGFCKGCGALRAAVVDLPGYEKETAETVSSFITDGLEVKRVSSQEVSEKLRRCRCKVNNR